MLVNLGEAFFLWNGERGVSNGWKELQTFAKCSFFEQHQQMASLTRHLDHEWLPLHLAHAYWSWTFPCAGFTRHTSSSSLVENLIFLLLMHWDRLLWSWWAVGLWISCVECSAASKTRASSIAHCRVRSGLDRRHHCNLTSLTPQTI